MQELLKKQHKQFGMPTFVTTCGNADRAKHLAEVKRMRDGIDPKSHASFGSVSLLIPELDAAVLKVRFPDLTSPDADIRTKAWQKFARSPLSEPYRTYKIKRGPQCRSTTAR